PAARARRRATAATRRRRLSRETGALAKRRARPPPGRTRSSPSARTSGSARPPPAARSLTPSFFFQRHAAHRDLHSFPTRRSSDLGVGSAIRLFSARFVRLHFTHKLLIFLSFFP